MNVTELARKLKIPTQELRELLPWLGFDVGTKAIKIDEKIAQRIIDHVKHNAGIIRQFRIQRLKPEAAEEAIQTAEPKILTVPSTITVRDFATMLGKPVGSVIQELMKNGILANLNEQIDYETASIIAQDFGFTTKPQKTEQAEAKQDASIEKQLEENQAAGVTRPPVIVVMGHVDHGKTHLLDAIRKTNVTAGEAGGITQHIGAYQVTVPTKEGPSSRPRVSEGGIPRPTRDEHTRGVLTFIDTPGHEAFTAMRSRGARAADLAVLVIAADDGIMPQTEEVITIIKNAKLPFVVALNKIDKPEADIQKVKQQLAQKNLLPEDWGGKTICVPISAKTGKGIDDLLEHLILLADMEKESIKGDPTTRAIGTIIESHIDKGEGPVATAIIQTGTLHRGDVVRVGQVVGKIRTLKNDRGAIIDAAPPSMPVKILGLKDIPEVGDFLQAVDERISLKKITKELQHRQKVYRDKQLWQTTKSKDQQQGDEKKTLPIILKADVLGSQEALSQSLESLSTDTISVKIIKKGLGNVTETDVLQAESGGAVIFGFHVALPTSTADLAQERNVPVRLYEVIYDLTDDVKRELERLREVKKIIVPIGRAKVIAVFHTEKSSIIVGGLVTKGKLETGAKVQCLRGTQIISEATIEKLQQGKQETREVPTGTECGIQLKGISLIEVGDFLEASREEFTK